MARSGVGRRRTPRCSRCSFGFSGQLWPHGWSVAASSRGNQEKSYQRKPCGQWCWTNISPAVSLSKKNGAVIGRAAGERYRPSKKLNQVCDPSGLTRDEAWLRRSGPLVGILNDEQDYDDCAENDQPIGNLNTCYRCFPLEPFHYLPPRYAASCGDNSKSGQDRPTGSAAKLLTKDEARRIAGRALTTTTAHCG